MTRQVNIAEAKARLSELIDAVLAGEQVVIARRNIPVVKLVVAEESAKHPQFGVLAGQIHLSEDFDTPLEDFADYR